MKDSEDLGRGLYDEVITVRLKELLAALDESRAEARVKDIDPEEAHEFLSRALAEVVLKALKACPAKDRLDSQLELCNNVLEVVAKAKTRHEVGDGDRLLGERLLAVLPAGDALAAGREMTPPGIPLSQSALLVNAPKDHRVGAELQKEIESADTIDLLCSFIKWSGYRRLRGALEAHCKAGKSLRIITTTYMGATEARALDEMHNLGANIRVSYDSRRTRLHAKAWYFQRDTGFDTAFVGSSNMSAAALCDGLEWNVRISAKEVPQVATKFRATFDNYWNDEEFETYDPERDSTRLRRSLKTSTAPTTIDQFTLDVRPYPFQEEILAKLWVERRVHDRWKNLVVAATGTGKTIMAALDYKSALRHFGGELSLLFVAHRREILEQSLSTFRHVLRNGQFGELFVGGLKPTDGRHIFASVQSLANADLAGIPPNRFDFIIVDEVHHSAATTYERLLDHFEPGILVGLTATPERTDGRSILDWFDGRISAELRLWDAIDRGLLAPFQYFVLNDDVDVSRIGWSRGRYVQSELDEVYTGNDARVRLIRQAVADYVPDDRKMRALGFCVSVDHAHFMAARFNELGIPAAALTAGTDRDTRRHVKDRLRNGEINVLFTVDLFNEGVDIPDVDTVLFLRPTESALLFIQQLGRGLRLTEDKECLTVLDFVGRVHTKFRFDLRFRALTGTTRRGLREQVEQGFPFLPSGCSIELDRVAEETVLENLRHTVSPRRDWLVREIKSFRCDVDLQTFLREAEVDLDDIYRSGRCWLELKREAGLPVPEITDAQQTPMRAFCRVTHWDDPELLDVCEKIAGGETESLKSSAGINKRLGVMVLSSLYGVEVPARLDEFLDIVKRHQAARAELRELIPVLRDRIAHEPKIDREIRLRGIPLSIRCRYSRDEVVAAHEIIRSGKLFQPREGVFFDADTGHNLLFVTLQKTEKDYSPTTMYDDYALSPTLFHWQSQSQTRAGSEKGRRHVHHRDSEITPLLFVRETKKDDRGITRPYLFLGPLEYVKHSGGRPMNIVWKLKYAMPMDAFRAAKVVAG